MTVLPITTAQGDFVARYSDEGLCRLEFPSKGRKQFSKDLSPEVRRWHALTTKCVVAVLSGGQVEALPPLDLRGGTVFQQSVWRALLQIRAGQTRTYSEVAAAVSRARAVRAVGGACGANPVPLLVPCHRVLAANRRIGGFSGGLHWKRALLEREGITLEAVPR